MPGLQDCPYQKKYADNNRPPENNQSDPSAAKQQDQQYIENDLYV